MNERLHPRNVVAANDRLDAWDAEGGAGAIAPGPSAADRAAAPTERVLLEHLGSALVQEWHSLPTPLRRAIYRRAIAREATHCDPAALRESLARLLHDHQARRREDAAASASGCRAIACLAPVPAADRWPPR